MKIGLVITGEHLTLAEMIQLAKTADERGFHSVWSTEFWRSAYVPLAAMAINTKKMKIGAGVALAFPRSPLLNALAAADMDELSGGRFILGLGSSTRRVNEQWHNREFSAPAARMAEYVQVLRNFWACWADAPGKPIRFDGEHFHINMEGYRRSAPPPRKDLPVYLGGVNRLMVRAAGRVADGIICHPVASAGYIRQVILPELKQAIEERHDGKKRVDMLSQVIYSAHADRDEARRRAKLQIAFYATVKPYAAMLSLEGFGDSLKPIRDAFLAGDIPAMGRGVTESMVDTLAVAGTPEECRSQVRRYDGILDVATLYAPTFGLSATQVKEGLQAIVSFYEVA